MDFTEDLTNILPAALVNLPISMLSCEQLVLSVFKLCNLSMSMPDRIAVEFWILPWHIEMRTLEDMSAVVDMTLGILHRVWRYLAQRGFETDTIHFKWYTYIYI